MGHEGRHAWASTWGTICMGLGVDDPGPTLTRVLSQQEGARSLHGQKGRRATRTGTDSLNHLQFVLGVELADHAARFVGEMRDEGRVLHGHVVVECRLDGYPVHVDHNDADHSLVRLEPLECLFHRVGIGHGAGGNIKW